MNRWPKHLPEDRDEAEGQGPDIVDGPEISGLKFDKKWLQLAQLDPKEFSKLYRKYQPKVYAFIFWMVKDSDMASDLTDETFYRALDKLDTYKWRGFTFGAWLLKIARNLVALEFRQQKYKPEIPFNPDFHDLDNGPRPDLDLIQREESPASSPKSVRQ